MNIRTCLLNLAAVLAVTAWSSSAAETTQSHRSIQEAAEAYILANVDAASGMQPSAKAGHLDSRLRLASCDAPLEAFQPNGGRTLGNTTVGVRCPGSKTWTLYVPVKVSLYGNVVTATRPLSRGMVVHAKDLQVVEKDLARIQASYFTDVSQVEGKQVTRRITMGKPITSAMVKAPRQIERGQRISLVAESGRLAVRMTGEALEDGAAGERIQVRNTSTKRILDGVVLSSTTVQVDI